MAHMKVGLKTKHFLEILVKNNWSQNGFAESARLSSGHFSQLVRGKRNVSPKTRKKILFALQGVKFEDIFSIKPSKRR